MDGERFNPAADELGIVTELRMKRYAKPMPAYRLDAEPRISPRVVDDLRKRIKMLQERNTRLALEVEALQRRAQQYNDDTSLVDQIITTVADVAGVDAEHILSHCQRKKGSAPRHFAMYLVRRIRWDLSFPQIGRRFHRDSSTVVVAVHKVENLLETEPFAGWVADPRIVALLALKKPLRPAQ